MTLSRGFAKLTGAGNDFIFIDLRETPVAVEARAELSRRLCDRRFGIGADGAVFVESNALGPGLRWDFFNNDGSHAEMCGNAARCLVRWNERRTKEKQIKFITTAGEVEGSVEGADVVVKLPFVAREARALSLSLGDPSKRAFLLDTGVPHAVLEVASLDAARAGAEVIQKLRWPAEAGARGSNATFFARRPGSEAIDAVTFERGVEGFTLACGTGVVAAALASRMSPDAGMSSSGDVEVHAPGGVLRVRYDQGTPGVSLRGPADWICQGEFAEEFLR